MVILLINLGLFIYPLVQWSMMSDSAFKAQGITYIAAFSISSVCVPTVQRNLLALLIPAGHGRKSNLTLSSRSLSSICVFIRHNAYFIIEELVDCGG
jgi:hypothetical protein